MARSRNVGGAASAWGLVIFGAGFLICLILTIMLYVNIAEAEQRAAEAEQELRTYVSEAEAEQSDTLRQLRTEGEGTVVSQLMSQRNQLAALVGGDTRATLENLQEQARETYGVDGPLFDELERLNDELQARAERVAALETSLEEARGQVEAAETQLAELRAQQEERAQELREELASVEQRMAESRSQADALQERFEQRVQEVQQERVTAVSASEDEVAQLQSQLQETMRELEICRRDRPRGLMEDRLRADGRISTVAGGGQQAYIDIGSEDNVVRGLTFEVFGPNEVIRPGGTGQQPVRGKATIEVVNVEPERAVTRVVRTTQGANIREGDQIINVAFDPDATYRFFVHGNFDIGTPGTATEQDRQLVTSIVRRWGGQVVDELNYQVDFVVLGEAPPLPDPLAGDEDDPSRIRAHAQAMQEYERYQAMIGEAQELQIPILNQNRFLSLVGFYER